MSATIAVDELRVGMFIHLDLKWWAHPFALSSFRLASPEQIATIKRLGVQQVRWSPEKSDLSGPNEAAPAANVPPAAEGPHAVASAEGPHAVASAEGPHAVASAEGPHAVASAEGPHAVASAERPHAVASAERPRADVPSAPPAGAAAAQALSSQRRRREQLAAAREAERLCTRQYNEAARSWQAAADLVASQPQAARESAEGLTRALLDKMMVDGELCIRVLTEVQAERTTTHALNVAVISMLMGRVFGFSEAEMLDVGVGALLHDVGKLELPERVRLADPQAAPADQALYREHVARGVAQGKRMGLSPGAMLVLAQHHEMADGSGFPQKLNVDRMTAAARIVALVNRYDNLCDPAVPAHALTPHEALSLIFAQTRSKFDASMLNAFIRMMGVYPPGSVVQLTDDRLALVTNVNSTRPLKPRVLLFDASVPAEDALQIDLERHVDLGIRRSLRPQQLQSDALQYLAPRQRVVYFFEPAQLSHTGHGQEMAA